MSVSVLSASQRPLPFWLSARSVAVAIRLYPLRVTLNGGLVIKELSWQLCSTQKHLNLDLPELRVC